MTNITTPSTSGTPLPVPPLLMPAVASPIDADVKSWLAREAERHAAFLANIPVTKARILVALAGAGVVRLRVDYDGYGDSGQLNDFTAILADGTTVALDDLAASASPRPLRIDGDGDEGRAETLAEAIESFCYDLIEAHHDGYENNEGGSGEFVFDVCAGSIVLTHNDNYVAVDTTEHAF